MRAAMDLIITGVAAGVLGTLVMDVMNHLFARLGIVSKIEVRIIGRMAAGWLKGRFMYRHPGEMKPAANELFYGYIAHYAIGLGLAFAYVIGWQLLIGGPLSLPVTFAYGIATTAASYFFVYPCMGFGAFGLRSPEGFKAPFSSLANHMFYAVGLVLAVALV